MALLILYRYSRIMNNYAHIFGAKIQIFPYFWVWDVDCYKFKESLNRKKVTVIKLGFWPGNWGCNRVANEQRFWGQLCTFFCKNSGISNNATFGSRIIVSLQLHFSKLELNFINIFSNWQAKKFAYLSNYVTMKAFRQSWLK